MLPQPESADDSAPSDAMSGVFSAVAGPSFQTILDWIDGMLHKHW